VLSGCVRCVLPGTPGVILKYAIAPLVVASLLLGLFITSRIQNDRLKAPVLLGSIALSLLFLVVSADLTSDRTAARYTPLVISGAEPFQWPEGCAKRRYARDDLINISCKRDENIVPRALVLDHAFPYADTRADQTYYRVGSDGINFRCNNLTQHCSVRWVERNVYQ
jgi:hypothetical protein